MSDKVKKNIFITIVLTVVIYLALSIYGDFNLVLKSLKAFNWEIFPIVLLVIFSTFLLKFIKWNYYLNILKLDVQLNVSFKIFMASLAMSLTPGKIGDLIKAYMLKEVNGIPINYSIPVVFAERVTEFVSLLFLVIIGVNLYNQSILIILISLLIILILFIILFNSRIINKIINLLSKSKKLEKYVNPILLTITNSKVLLSPKLFVLMTLFSVIIWLIEGFGFYLIVIQFSSDLSMLRPFFTYLFSIFIGSVSMLPAGLGITDGSLTFLLVQNGFSKDIAVSITLIARITTLWFALIIGIFGMIGFSRIIGKVKQK